MKTYSDEPFGESVEVQLRCRPYITLRHIDGPLLTFRDGQMHWLTIWERIQLWLGRIDAESLERKLRPNLMKVIE